MVSNLKKYYLNLHIHTVLSPCADLLMTPGNIVQQAVEKKIDIIAITDHNSAQNVEVALEMAQRMPLEVIPGIEVQTREEVHLICLFADLGEVKKLQEFIYAHLPDKQNREEFFGSQVRVDSNDQYSEKINYMLAAAADVNIGTVVKKVRNMGGLVIPAHVNRAYGLLYQLGFVPFDLNFPVMEIQSRTEVKNIKDQYPEVLLIKNGDSHRLNEINKEMKVMLKEPSFAEIKKVMTDLKRQKNITLLK